MNQHLFILCISLGGLLGLTLVGLFFVSRKSQRVMQSLLEIITHPERAKIIDASRVLQIILKDEIDKIAANFSTMSSELKNQIKHTEQINKVLVEQNGELITTADDATKKISQMSQRLENTVGGLKSIVASPEWNDVKGTTDNFFTTMDVLLDKITTTTNTTTKNAEKMQEHIEKSVEQESQFSEQLNKSFSSNVENMKQLTKTSNELEQQLQQLQASVSTGFDNIIKSSGDYDSVVSKNDELLNDYLIKLSSFTKNAEKELNQQVSTLKETANVVAGNIKLSEASVNKQLKHLEEITDKLNTSGQTTTNSVKEVTSEMTQLTNKFNKEIQDFSNGLLNEIKVVSGVANTTLENTKTAATEFANSVKNMGIGVNATLIEMNKAHSQLSTQSESLIKMSSETAQQIKPLSELIEKYYSSLPNLAKDSHQMNESLNSIVDTLVNKIETMNETISDSLNKINTSSTQLNTVAGQSRQQMIDLMSDYAKAVDAMQSLNKQMMIARASAPMEAIKVAPSAPIKQISTRDFMNQVDKLFTKLYEQSVDLTRASNAEIPEIVWKKYNAGDNKIFAKWLIKMFEATDKKQIRELLKSDKIFYSQATQFVHNFEKVLRGADQTNDAEKLRTTLLKTDLGIIYTTLHKNM